jgi:SNF family Na+-dependent transporter
MQSQKAQKAEKIIGYVLLTVGLILIIFPACLAMWEFLSQTPVPQLVPTPTAQNEFAVAFASFSNVCMIFFIFAIMVWAGSIVTSRGVAMIKDVKLKMVKKSLDEAAQAISKTETEK